MNDTELAKQLKALQKRLPHEPVEWAVVGSCILDVGPSPRRLNDVVIASTPSDIHFFSKKPGNAVHLRLPLDHVLAVARTTYRLDEKDVEALLLSRSEGRRPCALVAEPGALDVALRGIESRPSAAASHSASTELRHSPRVEKKSGKVGRSVDRLLEARQEAQGPAPKTRLGRALKGFDEIGVAAARFNLSSSDAATREQARALLEERARKEQLAEHRVQTELLRSISSGASVGPGPPSVTNQDLDPTQVEILGILERRQHWAQRYAREEFQGSMLVQFNDFDEYLDVQDSDLRLFTNGVWTLGYAARQAEEGTSFDVPQQRAFVSAGVAAIREATRSDDALSVSNAYAVAVAEGRVIGGHTFALSDFPGDEDLRDVLRESSLKLLTDPPATFNATPAGLNDALFVRAWSHGYGLRCVHPAVGLAGPAWPNDELLDGPVEASRESGPRLQIAPTGQWGPRVAQEPPTVQRPPTVDFVDQMAKLAELHRAGALTDDEFTAAKRRLLA